MYLSLFMLDENFITFFIKVISSNFSSSSRCSFLLWFVLVWFCDMLVRSGKLRRSESGGRVVPGDCCNCDCCDEKIMRCHVMLVCYRVD